MLWEMGNARNMKCVNVDGLSRGSAGTPWPKRTAAIHISRALLTPRMFAEYSKTRAILFSANTCNRWVFSSPHYYNFQSLSPLPIHLKPSKTHRYTHSFLRVLVYTLNFGGPSSKTFHFTRILLWFATAQHHHCGKHQCITAVANLFIRTKHRLTAYAVVPSLN